MQRCYSKWLASLLLASLLINVVLTIRLLFPVEWYNWSLSLITPPQLTTTDHTRGPAEAPAVIVYTNYQCPYCAKLNAELLALAEEVNFLWSYRHYADPKTQTLAFEAAMAAECAGDQNKFWEYNDQVFIDAKTLNKEHLQQIAEQLSLNMTAFTECTNKEKYKDRLIASKQEANDKKIMATPTFFINGKRYIGIKPPAELKQLIVAAGTST